MGFNIRTFQAMLGEDGGMKDCRAQPYKEIGQIRQEVELEK